MLSPIRTLLACVALTFVSLTAFAVIRPSDDADASDHADVGLHGPILLPAGAPYLNQPIADSQTLPLPFGPATESPQDREEPGEAEAVEAPTARPASEDTAKTEDTAESEDTANAEDTATEEPQQPSQNEVEQPTHEKAEQPSGEEAQQPPDDEATDTAQPEKPALPKPKPELTTAQAVLRDRVRRAMAPYRQPLLSTRENTATDLMHYCLAFGCGSEVSRSGSPGGRGNSRQKVNGITCLCWNYPCAGFQPLQICDGHIAARIGYGLQEQRSQLLAMLAFARVQADYPMRAGDDVRTVADLVESEKLSCRSGTDLSLKLIGLAYYLADEPTWKNDLGEDWSVERIIQEELTQPVIGSAGGGTQRLLGLSYVLDRRAKRKQPIEGQFRRAQRFIDEFHDYALRLQNRDGSWGPQCLAGKGTSRDPLVQLRSTGEVLRWLALSFPTDRLGDPEVVRAVNYVSGLLENQRFRRNLRSMKTRDIAAVSHALHALAIYDRRFFRPRTPPPTASASSVQTTMLAGSGIGGLLSSTDK